MPARRSRPDVRALTDAVVSSSGTVPLSAPAAKEGRTSWWRFRAPNRSPSRACPAGCSAAAAPYLSASTSCSSRRRSTPSASAIGTEDEFFDLGLTSVAALELREHLTTLTGLEWPADVLYECPTPRVLTDPVVERLIADRG
ncbi:acyl carrier protein [Streptomyces klenkii]|uniref:acyl carrier protein n=1 Tax=Streptomyces klenkii TaxID=1420899 RepID=UPI0033B4CEB1